ncbi:methyl-accepting chemotaxis protein [Calothrix sp. PCC 6303]|uniref:methyl-accepting chemotaxis protein n=1 Tax=Calothrix sp. PCC 6303 TaxID=1170562 RepID=UPI0002A00C66|nr:methyl-accepting chemotaxis protein [Calothrix sp. PCC 6303]AFZ03795.1 methyl-accepting chemotaxis sensory transducer with GAF sensor [Calothrix sp. PCC 6303]
MLNQIHPQIKSDNFSESTSTLTSSNETIIQPRTKAESKLKSNHFEQVWVKSLRTKVICFAATVGTLPVFSIAALSYYLGNESISKQVTSAKEASALNLVENINDFITTRYTGIQEVAASDFLVNPKIRNNLNVKDIQRQLNPYKTILVPSGNITVLDLNGDVFVETAEQKTVNQKEQAYFQTVLKTNQPIISQVKVVDGAEKSQFYLAAPVKGKDGELLYIVQTTINLPDLEKKLSSYDTSKGQYQLTDGNGQVILSSDKQLLNKSIVDIFPDLKQEQIQGKPITNILINKNNNTKDFVTSVSLNTSEQLSNLGWKLFINSNESITSASQQQLLILLSAGTLIAAFLTGGISAVMANRLIFPILTATKTVKLLASGNLHSRIKVQGYDELSILGANINRMADQLQDLLSSQQNEAEQLKAFNNALISIRQSLDSEDLFEITVKQVRQALKAHRVVIYHFNDRGNNQVLAETMVSGLSGSIQETFDDNFTIKDLLEKYQGREVSVINNIAEANLSADYLKVMEKLKIKSSLITPIFKENQLFGFLVAHYCFAPHIWQPSESNFLRQLATQVGSTLERVSLLDATRSLKDVAVHMSATTHTQDIYNIAVQDIRKALKCDRVVIYKFNQVGQGSFVSESIAQSFTCALGVSSYDPCLMNDIHEYSQGEVLVTHNVYEAGLSDSCLQQLEAFEVKASLVAPILDADQLQYLLIAHQCTCPRSWEDSEIDLFEQFARLVGLALERASLLEETEQARKNAEIFSEQQAQQKEDLQQQVLQLVDSIEGVCRGDLTARAEVTSEEMGTVADFFNSIVESLSVIVTQVKQTASQVNEAITEDSQAIAQLATNALQQAEEIDSTLDAVGKMRGSIKSVARSARMAAVVARNASQTAEKGEIAMDLTVDNIMNLRETIGETTKKVKRLGESSQKISHVVSLINQIALKTNLLAINAGIEAARAGEGGEGFAVVAEEVAALAVRSASATTEIEAIVANIQLETSEVVKAMELGTTQVVEGTHLVEDTKQSLNQILEVCHQIDGLVQGISTATVSQVQISKQVTNGMKEIAKVSDITKNSSWEVAASLQQTVEISQRLQDNVDTFNVG